jgi:predicted nucleic acid-binding protein
LPVCLDASIFLKLALEEEDSEPVRRLWAGSLLVESFVAPELMLYETVSTLRKKTVRGLITAEEAESILEYLMMQPVEIVPSLALHSRALQLAEEFDRPNAYDAQYLALAEAIQCQLWTADERLFNAVRGRFPLIRLATKALAQD